MKFFIPLILFFTFPAFGASSIKHEATLTFNQLQEFVSGNSIKSLDQLVPLLPTQMLKNSLLVYNSHALKLDLVTPNSPRIILFNKDATLILAMTKNPGLQKIDKNDDTLEIISFDPDSRKFEFFDVAFNGKVDPFEKPLKKNPALCLQCHGQNPRPIFQDYNGWPGFYGSYSQRGFAAKDSVEHKLLQDFLALKDDQPRYKDLDFSRVYSEPKGIGFRSSGYGPVYEEYKFSPALAFGAMLEFRMYERLAKKIEDLPETKQFIHLISYLGRANACLADRTGHRREIHELYKHWVNALGSKAQNLELIAKKIESQVSSDFLHKKELFTEFNIPTDLDSRGLINLPYETFVLGSPPWVKVDKAALAAQFVIMESLSRILDLDNEDFSTTPGYPTLGVFHIRKTGLLEDEQMIKGVYEGLQAIGSDLIQQASNMTCVNLKAKALQDLEKLPAADPSKSGVFYR